MIDDLLIEAHKTASAAGDRAAERLDTVFDEADARRVNTAIRFIHTDRLSNRLLLFDERHTTITHRINTNSQRDAFSLLLFEGRIEEEIVEKYSLTDGKKRSVSEELFESKLIEVGNTISAGLIDEWAEGAPSEVTINPPKRRTGVYPEKLLPDEVRWMQGVVPMFETLLEAGEHQFKHYFIPSSDTHLYNLLGDSSADVADFPRSVEAIVAEGATKAEESINTQLESTEVKAMDWSLRFTTPDMVEEYSFTKDVVGSTFELTNTLDGYGYVAFDRQLASNFAFDLLEQTGSNTTEELTRSIVRELSLHVLSAFSDGWANVSAGEVDYTPPSFTNDTADNVLSEIAGNLDSEYVFVFTAQFESLAGDEFDIIVVCKPDGVVSTAQSLETLFPD